MGGYLKPWRTRFGVITLAIACAATAGWVVSLTQAINLDVYLAGGLQAVAIARGHLFIALVTKADPPVGVGWIDYELNLLDQFPANVWEGREVRWRLNAGFFDCGLCIAESSSSIDVWLFVVPLWSLVISLTFLSAWLLLSKPRPHQPKPASEA